MPAIPHYSKSRHWELILGFIIIGGIGAAFGHWFSLQQVHAVYHLADFAEFPIFARCMTIARCTLAVAAMYALSHRILSLMCAHRIPPAHTACTFIPLLAVYLSPKVSCLVAAILLLQVITACYYLHREGGKSWLGHALPDAIVLVILCALHFHYTTMFSPLVSDAPLTSLQGFNT